MDLFLFRLPCSISCWLDHQAWAYVEIELTCWAQSTDLVQLGYGPFATLRPYGPSIQVYPRSRVKAHCCCLLSRSTLFLNHNAWALITLVHLILTSISLKTGTTYIKIDMVIFIIKLVKIPVRYNG